MESGEYGRVLIIIEETWAYVGVYFNIFKTISLIEKFYIKTLRGKSWFCTHFIFLSLILGQFS